MLRIEAFGPFRGEAQHLRRDDGQPSMLETRVDFANQVARHGIGLDDGKRPLQVESPVLGLRDFGNGQKNAPSEGALLGAGA